MAAGAMVQLAASSGKIDTSDQLQMVEAYGKVFIANGENLKVADFQNTKIATADLGSHAPDRGNELTGGTSGAKMIVDYITALTGATTIYGYRTTTATFSAGETVTGTDDDGNAISFAMTAADEVAPPHWYDWTVYGGSADYGTMPNQAYLVWTSGGRLMLSGDRDYPHQIRASAIAFPWDFNVNRTTATRAVAIGTGSAGAIGDVVRAGIPAGDGYVYVGCASSIHVIIGNPADGGQIIPVDHTVGMFDGTSWCLDGDGNLYFYGTGGVYRLPKGARNVENLSRTPLPNLIQDEAADPSTHRITMGYDADRGGIKIAVTVLATGVGSYYWFDLQTNAFCPEAHQTDHGIYSMFYYDANDPDNKALLMGCKDGYIRIHDDDADDDDGSAIDSYVWFGPIELGTNGREGSLGNIRATLAGGAGGGSAADSDDVTFSVYADESAEDIIETMDEASPTPQFGGTFNLANTRRGNRRRQSARGTYGAIKLGNSSNNETWGLEKLIVGE